MSHLPPVRTSVLFTEHAGAFTKEHEALAGEGQGRGVQGQVK
jgi:hypothetical protein